jgi:hypothetical protein
MTNLAAPITEIKKSVDGLNVETSLFRYNEGKYAGRYAVRVKDLDVGEVVGITVYPDASPERAFAAYDKIVSLSTAAA